MKKVLAVCLIAMLLCTALATFACADGGTWHCATCDEDRDTAFCPVCGAKRPDEEPASWYCPTCGKEIIAEYSFCPDDGTEKPGFVSAWPKRKLTGVPVTVKPYPDDPGYTMRRQSYLGPDKNKYSGAGSFRPSMVTSATAFFCEGNCVFVDLLYHETEKRVVYFLKDSLRDVPASLETVKLTEIPAKVKITAAAMMGPGFDYEVLEINEKTKTEEELWDYAQIYGSTDEMQRALWGKEYPVILESGTKISVFFECDGWVFAEFGTARGNVRAWLPANAVEP